MEKEPNQPKKTHIAFTRKSSHQIDLLRVLGFTHTQALKSEQEVLDALQKAVTHWIETTPQGLAAWEESCEDFNIGDLCSCEDFELQASLKSHGILSIETIYEFTPNQEVDYDKILAHPNLSENGSENGQGF